ncbi:hypothetical protein ES703_56119 [subsurface metagenome]
MIDCAALSPAAMASTAIEGPVWQSPPAKTPSRLVSKVIWSTSIVPRLEMFIPLFSKKESSGVCPMAGTTMSIFNSNSEPGMGIGRLLPLVSGSPSSIRIHLIPATFPFSQRISTGATKYSIFTPSVSAASTSSSLAGISTRVLR